jgi:hypothetical protein
MRRERELRMTLETITTNRNISKGCQRANLANLLSGSSTIPVFTRKLGNVFHVLVIREGS